MIIRDTILFAGIGVALIAALLPTEAFSANQHGRANVKFLTAEGQVIDAAYFPDSEVATFFIIHGFRDRGTGPASLRQAEAIRHHSPKANVIVVDWQLESVDATGSVVPRFAWLGGFDSLVRGAVALDAEYGRAVEAADQVADAVASWMKEKGILPSRTVVSGHSLGAQIAAFLSNRCSRPELFNEPIAALICADPAGPLFRDRPAETRLDRSDAQQVIVVHATEILGDPNRLGSVDIYVSWPERKQADFVWQHSQSRELVTRSFLMPEMSNSDGTPFGGNALASNFGDGRPREFLAGE